MENFIRYILSNFSLTFFLIGLIFSFVVIFKKKGKRSKSFIVETLFKYFCFWAHGVTWIYNGIFHVVFHEMAAKFIGWEDSPFQFEVGFASIGFGVTGLLALRKDFGLRLALIIGTSCFLWGAASVHIYEINTSANYAPGNAGIMLWTGILLPVIGFVGLYLSHLTSKKSDVNFSYK